MDSLVTTVTRSRWSHVALLFDADSVLVESLAGRGTILQPEGKYDKWTHCLKVRQWVPVPVYDEMLQLSRQWATANISYGYSTCVAIGLKELLGQRAGLLALGWLTGRTETMVCSEMAVELWRLAVPGFLPGREARLVSPDELYQALAEESGGSQN